ncbi:MAG: hypothetical protein ACSHXF_16775 [Aquaticitalea sp.]
MKKIIKLVLILFVTMNFVSCDEDVDPVIYNGAEGENRTFLSFNRQSYNLPVAIDDMGTLEIILNSSTTSSADRTFNIQLVSEETTADATTYTLPSTVTIPAGSYQGILTVVGMDNNLVEPTAEQIVFNLTGLNESQDTDFTKVSINIFEVCPVPTDYLIGDYMLTDSNANLGDEVVTISAGSESTNRTFVATFLPGSSVERPTTVSLNLVCNSFVMDDVDENLTCQQGGPGFILGAAGVNNSTYTIDDDNVVTVNYIEDPLQSCGAPSLQSFTLTKI